MLEYLLVAGGYLVEVVLLHELVEHICAEYHRLWNLYGHSRKSVEFRVHLYHVVQECQTSSLAAERPFADARKVGILVKLAPVEHRYHAYVFHLAILHNGIEDDLPVSVHVL